MLNDIIQLRQDTILTLSYLIETFEVNNLNAWQEPNCSSIISHWYFRFSTITFEQTE